MNNSTMGKLPTPQTNLDLQGGLQGSVDHKLPRDLHPPGHPGLMAQFGLFESPQQELHKRGRFQRTCALSKGRTAEAVASAPEGTSASEFKKHNTSGAFNSWLAGRKI